MSADVSSHGQASTDQSDGRARIASREEWLTARIALLEKEKALTAMKEALSAARRALPWVRIEKDYVFDGRAAPSPWRNYLPDAASFSSSIS